MTSDISTSKPAPRQRNLRARAIADKAREYITKLFRHPQEPPREARLSYFGLLASRVSTAERTRRATLSPDWSCQEEKPSTRSCATVRALSPYRSTSSLAAR